MIYLALVENGDIHIHQGKALEAIYESLAATGIDIADYPNHIIGNEFHFSHYAPNYVASKEMSDG